MYAKIIKIKHYKIQNVLVSNDYFIEKTLNQLNINGRDFCNILIMQSHSWIAKKNSKKPKIEIS